MLKYLTKFTMDILPSVAATIIGAYIVNHYIAAKPAADAPVAAAASTANPKTTNPKAVAKVVPVKAKADTKVDSKAAEAPSDVASIPEAGVTAKGISERGMLEKSAAEMPITPVEKPAEKPAEAASRPTETASLPVETRRHALAQREKAVAKSVTQPVAEAPVLAAPSVQAATAPEERHDANDLARAAIERLRGGNEGSLRAADASKAATAIRPLPPPIVVTAPSNEQPDIVGTVGANPPYIAARVDDPRRPTPPADIPYAQPPLDLRADATEPLPLRRPTVAEGVLSAARSVLHAVIPR
jgi:hypothetical protein